MKIVFTATFICLFLKLKRNGLSKGVNTVLIRGTILFVDGLLPESLTYMKMQLLYPRQTTVKWDEQVENSFCLLEEDGI